MPVSLGGQAPASFDLKSAHLPLLALLLKSSDLDLLRREFAERYGDQPDFFDHDPLLIDLHGVSANAVPDLAAVAALLREHRLCAVAVHARDDDQRAAAQAAGLPVADGLSLPRTEPAKAVKQQAAPSAPAVVNPAALVIDKPLRSGQQVYARGRDLVVLAPVNPGAEVIADGHIHVYAPLRGKAIAGAWPRRASSRWPWHPSWCPSPASTAPAKCPCLPNCWASPRRCVFNARTRAKRS